MLAYDVTIVGVSGGRSASGHSPDAPAGSGWFGTPPNPAGYLSSRLLRTGEIVGRGEITLRDADREDLAAGRLSIRLFTRQQPFGLMLQSIVIER